MRLRQLQGEKERQAWQSGGKVTPWRERAVAERGGKRAR
jgi:hypothetical protein